MSGRHSEFTDCKPTTMTGTTACWIGSWFWVCGGIDVDDGDDGDAVESGDDEDKEGSVETDVGGDVAINAMVGVGGVVVVAGTKGCRKLTISMRGGMTGGKRYNLHQLILPDASILPAPRVGLRGELFNPGLEACLAEWKSRQF